MHAMDLFECRREKREPAYKEEKRRAILYRCLICASASMFVLRLRKEEYRYSRVVVLPCLLSSAILYIFDIKSHAIPLMLFSPSIFHFSFSSQPAARRPLTTGEARLSPCHEMSPAHAAFCFTALRACHALLRAAEIEKMSDESREQNITREESHVIFPSQHHAARMRRCHVFPYIY